MEVKEESLSCSESTVSTIKRESCDDGGDYNTKDIIRDITKEVKEEFNENVELFNDFDEELLLTEAVKEEYMPSMSPAYQNKLMQQELGDGKRSLCPEQIEPVAKIENSSATTTTTNAKDLEAQSPSLQDASSFECFSCRRQFLAKMQVKMHLNRNCSRTFECTTCRQRFKCAAYLNTHRKTHSSNGRVMKKETSTKVKSYESLFPCIEPSCDKTFHRRDRLLVHIRTHTGDKRYRCDEIGCHKTFSEWSNLDKHRRIHVGDRRFVCEEPGCNKKFAAKCNLIELKRTHAGGSKSEVKPFVCEICHKSMRHSSTFSKHQKMHSGVKPYACEHEGCDKRFLRRYRLKEHSYIHSGEKPFGCTNCERKFNDKTSLRKHLLTHVKDVK